MSLLTLTPSRGWNELERGLPPAPPPEWVPHASPHPPAGSLVSLALPGRVMLGSRHAGWSALAKAGGPCGPRWTGASVSGRCAQRQAGQRWGPRPCGLLEPRAFLIRRPAAASLLGLQTPHSSPHGPRGPMPDPGLMGLQFPPGALAGESVSRPLDLLEPPAPLGSWPFLTALPSSQPAREVETLRILEPPLLPASPLSPAWGDAKPLG